MGAPERSAYGGAAALYDVVHAGRGKNYAAEVERVAREIRTRLPGARTVLDVACGTGGHLAGLAELFEVEGLDLSEEMLAVAARRCPGVPLHHADMRDFDLGRRFDAVVCLFSSIGYLTERADLDAGIAAMARHLVPGGVLVVEPWIHPDGWLGDGVHADAGRTDDVAAARVTRATRDGRITVLEMRFVAASAGGFTTFDETHRMALYTVEEYRLAFERVGLTVDHDREGLIGRGVFVGVRP